MKLGQEYKSLSPIKNVTKNKSNFKVERKKCIGNL